MPELPIPLWWTRWYTRCQQPSSTPAQMSPSTCCSLLPVLMFMLGLSCAILTMFFLMVLLQPGASTFITNVSVNDIPSGWLAEKPGEKVIATPATSDTASSSSSSSSSSSVVMNLVNRRKAASISNIWSPQRRVKLQNRVRTTETATGAPQLVAQQVVPVATTRSGNRHGDDSSEEQLQPTTIITAQSSGLWPIVSTHATTLPADKDSGEYVEDDGGEEMLAEIEVTDPEDIVVERSTKPPLIEDDVDLLTLIDELPDIDSSSFELIASDENRSEPLAATASTAAAESKSTSSSTSSTLGVTTANLSADSADENDSFLLASDSYESGEAVRPSAAALIKAKRAIGNERHLPQGAIVRPAAVAKSKAKQTLAERLQNETSAERAERVQKGIQRLMHFVTIIGHVDSYLTKRFRTGVKKMARLYDSTEDAHRRPLAPRRRRRIGF